MNDSEWKRLFETSERPASLSPCPAPEVAATWASGPLPPYAVSHLAACAACRDVLVVLRRPPAPARVSSALRNRLPGRRPPTLYWVAAAAAVVLVALTLMLFRSPEPMPVVTLPNPKPKPVLIPEAPLPVPEPPKPAPLPEPPKPAPEKPAPIPVPEPPVVIMPPKPEPVVPVPAKPAPEPTRATLKGTLVSIAGTCSTQTEAEAQPLKPGQKREFPGSVRIKTDNPVKFAIGTTTYYLQRSSELAIQLQEGRTSVKLARGEAFFDVTPGNGLFEVEGAAGKVVVKGTRFLVSETEVLVQRGAVEHTSAGQTSTLTPKPKADLSRRLAWVRGLEDSLWIEAEQLALQGMVVIADTSASGGRAIGMTKPGVDAAAEIRGKRKQAVPYAVWVRLLWIHNVPSSLGLTVGTLTWSAKDIASAPGWQWVHAGNTELPDDAFRLRVSDTKVGLKVDQLLITSDLDFNPETDKR